MDLVQLTMQAGGIGVAIYAISILKTLVSNHLTHSTTALEELTQAIKDLREFLINHNG